MALWARVQQLTGDAMRHMQSVYGAHFPIEVRHFFANWIEEQPWADVDEENPEHEKFAIHFREELLGLMEAKGLELSTDEMFLTKLKLQETCQQFRQFYEKQPMSLVRVVKNCLATEARLVQQADSMNGDSKQANVNRQILEKFEALQRSTQETEAELRRMQLNQEQFIIQYQESLKINNQLAQLAAQPNGQTRLDNEQRLQKQKQTLDAQLSQNAQQLLKLRLALAEQHNVTCQNLSELQAHFLDEQLIGWKRMQQLAGNGAQFDASLDTLQQWCETLADLVWQNRQQIKKVELLRNQLPINLPPNTVDLIPALNSTITNLLSSLVTSTFIIEKQPPQVLKKDSRFTATIRLLVGGKLNVHMNPPTVKATIISEEQARTLLKHDKASIKNDTCGDILNNMGTMEYHQANGQLSVTFRNMALKRIRRAEKKGNETVTEEKFSILFQSQFSVGGGELVFQVWTLSLPAVVTVHGNQECNALATILWDNAFAEPGRLPFHVPEKVPWPALAQALNTKFASHCGLGLSPDNLSYLGFKLFGQSDDYSTHFVTWTQFNREPLQGRNFTFWEWFYSILKLTKDWLHGQWKDRLIHGFVSKQQAQEWLLKSCTGTFLLRFSDSELGGITIAWVAEDKGERTVWNLAPFTDKNFRVRNLGDTIKDLQNLVYLFPNMPKAQCFGKFWTHSTNSESNSASNGSGYVKPDLLAVIPGLSKPPEARRFDYDETLNPCSPFDSVQSRAGGGDMGYNRDHRSYTPDGSVSGFIENDDLMGCDLMTDYNPEDIDQISVNELIQSYHQNFQ